MVRQVKNTMNSLFVLFCLANLAFASASLDYCELNCTDIGWPHIRCGKNESLGSRCPEDTLVFDFSNYKSVWTLMLDLHNNFRHKVAGGGLTGFPKATTMGTMSWSNEHSKNAYYSVKDCVYEPDICHDVEKGKKSGQNIAVFYFGKEVVMVPTVHELIKRAFEEWEDSCTLAENPKKVVESFPESGLNTYSSCLRMAKESNNKVGCSNGIAPNGNNGYIFWLLCNYEEDIEVGQKSYNAIPEVASSCGSVNSNYSNLCSLDQKY